MLVIVVITYLIGIGVLSHVIAGSTEVAYAALVGGIGWDGFFLSFLLPALAGNIVGGLALVAVLNHAQVRHEV